MITITDVIGFIGGIILSISSLPQLIHLFQTRSAKDISKLSTLTLLAGLLMTAVYLTLISAWAGAVPVYFETFMAFILVIGKAYLDHMEAKGDEHKTKIQASDDHNPEAVVGINESGI
jgi:uncharacterized protein with PQ loop repeat